MAVRSRAAGGAESAEKQRLAEGPGNASLCASEALCVSRSPAPRAASRPGSPRGPAASRGVSESRRHTFQVSEKARSATARDRPVTQNAPGFPEPCAKQRAWSGPCEHPRACAALCQAKELAAIRGSSRVLSSARFWPSPWLGGLAGWLGRPAPPAPPPPPPPPPPPNPPNGSAPVGRGACSPVPGPATARVHEQRLLRPALSPAPSEQRVHASHGGTPGVVWCHRKHGYPHP
jgi:hypothetical protein